MIRNFKVTHFAFGVIAGVIIGIVISMLFIINNENRNMLREQNDTLEKKLSDHKEQLSESVNKNTSKHKKVKTSNPKEKNKSAKKKKRLKKASQQNRMADSANKDFQVDSSLAKQDTTIDFVNDTLGTTKISTFSTNDTIASTNDTDSNYLSDNQEDIVVIRDELVHIRSVEIVGLSLEPDAFDSLINSNRNYTDNNPNVYRVEIWRSPVNYHGYKLAKNKVILYGINPYDSLSFKYVNDSILLEHINNVYLLEQDENFKQLKPLETDL
jgi:uncharacterized membrane-anchored protein YhcB (DUF1043 family)